MSAAILPTPYDGVMVSSTFLDLQEHRQIIVKILNDFQLMHVAMENSSAQPDVTVIDSSIDMVRRAAAYILIIGARYGNIPNCPLRNPHQLSITELEFAEAQRLGRPILLFIFGDDYPVPKSRSERDPSKLTKLEAFTERAKRWKDESELNRVYATFNSLEEFQSIIPPAIAKLKERLGPTPISRVSESMSIDVFEGIRAPALYAAPPYLGSHEFLGRTDQIRTLDEWVRPSDPHPVLLIEAIGGMGKSILSWNWLNHSAKVVRPDLAGRFWYSFYERGAQSRDFLLRALEYMYGLSDPSWEKFGVPDLTKLLTKQLHIRPWLVVLDGIERLLVDYNRFDAEYRSDETAGTKDSLSNRKPHDMVRSDDDQLFRALLTVEASKILITSRLLPRCMVNASQQPLPGLLHQRLPGLHSEDAEKLFRACGVDGESHSIRAYLRENCDCHPLVVGVLAGFINRYLPARGNFDQWRVASDGGLMLNMSKLDLIGRRNHIISTALLALTEESRELLGSLSMMLNEFDYKVLVALSKENTHNPENDLFVQVEELERHGFLLFNRRSKLYDVHPVVRAVAIGTLMPEVRERVGDRVLRLDYFTAAAAVPLSEAQSLEDALPAIQLVQTNLTLQRFEQALALLQSNLYNALWLNLERSDRNLALLRPFFTDGWVQTHTSIPKADKSTLLNLAGVALGALELHEDACTCFANFLKLQIELGEPIDCALRNFAASLRRLGYLSASHLLYRKAIKLAEAGCDDESTFLANKALMSIEADIGNRDAAEQHWSAADTLGRDWDINRYREGEAEYSRERCLYLFGLMSDASLRIAESYALDKRSSRAVKRDFLRLRGHWHLDNKEYASAIRAFGDAVAMAREVGLRDVEAETALALSRQLEGTLIDGMSAALQLEAESRCSEVELALLFEAVADYSRALMHAYTACEEASRWGEPWVIRKKFDTAHAIIQRRGGGKTFEIPPSNPHPSWPDNLIDNQTLPELIETIDGVIEKLRRTNAERIGRRSAMNEKDRRIAAKGHLVHKLKAKDSTGRWAYYFVLVLPSKEEAFLKALKSNETIDLEDFGEVIASCYGEEPNEGIRKDLYERFGFQV